MTAKGRVDNMKYIEVNKNNMAAFSWLCDPDELLRLTKETETFAIGAVEEEHNWSVGILIFSALKDNTIVHHWLYVASEFRGRGIATEIMHRFNEVINDLKVSKVSFVFPDNKYSQSLIPFYQGFGYRFERTLIPEMRTKLGELCENRLFREQKIPEGIAALEAAKPSEIKQFMGAVPKIWRDRFNELSTGSTDQKVSSIYLRHHRICAALLVDRNPSGKLVPVLFCSLER
ncbi:MAG: GNAT family N-acetyltransferase, partial [Lachnospiraceae bacterium]|nr:GNAT family N-acetyltransferase [Lachnospiraceae bacterium]